VRELIQLSEVETEMVGGGQVVGPIVVQNAVNAGAQVSIGLAVLTNNTAVNARASLFTLQLNAAAVVGA
jgi:hypothetical protein